MNGIDYGEGYDTYDGVDYYDKHPYDWDAYYEQHGEEIDFGTETDN